MQFTVCNLQIANYKSQGIRYVKLGFCDIDGVHRGKYVSLRKFTNIVADNAGFCDCVLGWDLNDQLYDNASFTGWHTAFPDALFRIDLESERRLSEEGDTPFFIIDFIDARKDPAAQTPHPICPRSLLKRVLAKADGMGYSVRAAFEYEFFVFDETIKTDSYIVSECISVTDLGLACIG